MKATGSFEVKMTPLDFSAQASDGAQLGRMSIDKIFHGDLSAQSKGEMLSAMSSVKGSAGYVAIEQANGTLHGKKGSFILQHFGTMAGTDNKLILEVVPNSGSRELENISGTMAIIIKEGKHFYEFDYQL